MRRGTAKGGDTLGSPPFAEKSRKGKLLGRRTRTRRGVALANLEASKSTQGDVLTHFGDGLINEFLDGNAFVLDKVLLVKAVFFVELFHLSGNDLLDDRFWLSGRFRLLAVN